MEFQSFSVLLLLVFLVYWLRGLDWPGVLAATLMALLVVYKASLSWLMLLSFFFFLGTVATHLFSGQKSRLHRPHEVRGWKNVVANGTVAAVAAYFNSLPAFIGAVAAVTADTLSCEIGELHPRPPVLITTFKPVPPGTDGAVSPLGEAAGVLAGLLIGMVADVLKLGPAPAVYYVAIISAAVGTNFDSLLGATLERDKTIDKHCVNFLASLAGALAGLYVYGFFV